MSGTTAINPRSIKHGLVMFQVFRALAERGRTLESLQKKPRVRFTQDELTDIATIQGRPFGRDLISNQFANESIGLALSGDKLAAILFRHHQLKTSGLTGTIHGNKPAVIDLEPLYLTYLGPAKDMEAQLISLDIHHWIKPEDIKMKASFDMGDSLEATFKTNERGDKILVTAPAIFADDSSSEKKRAPFSDFDKPQEVKGLVLQGKDGGKRLEVSTKTPFSGTKTIVLPLITSFDWIELVPINIEYKKR